MKCSIKNILEISQTLVDNSKAWNPVIFAQRNAHTFRIYT